MTGEEVFVLEALDVSRGARRVIAGLSFRLHPGECLALVGPSGSGKTTSCLAPFGLLSGSAEVGGHYRLGRGRYRAGAMPGSGAVRMALLLQAPGDNFSPDVPLDRQLADASGLAGARAERDLVEARALAAELGLQDFADLIRRPPAWVSRGELQRVALVAALLSRPRLLVADEPTAALDDANRQRWCALVNRWRDATGMAVWLATHDRQVIQALGARPLVLAPDSPPEAVATAPAREPNPTVGTEALVRLGDRVLTPGKALVIVGASGSGKSTLLRRIADLATAASGLRRRAGEPPLEVSPLPRGRQGLAMVFQDPRSGLNPHRAVADSIAAVLRLGGVREPAGSTAWLQAELAGLDLPVDCASRRPAALSLGQMQRVALILALASSPRLLLCDEPTSALGSTHRLRVVERLRQAMANGVGLIIATHDHTLTAGLGGDAWSVERRGEGRTSG